MADTCSVHALQQLKISTSTWARHNRESPEHRIKSENFWCLEIGDVLFTSIQKDNDIINCVTPSITKRVTSIGTCQLLEYKFTTKRPRHRLHSFSD